jgi:hypothetical protein
MRLTALVLALLCVVCSSAYACDAMRPCYGNGKPLYDSAVAQDSFSARRAVRHRAVRHAHRRVPEGLARVMAEGAGRAVNWHRPRAWCGWWMRRHLGVANPAGNLARWWAGFGRPAHGPAVGAIVVWRHHVGIITARAERGWVVKSGNDGHRVRERPRSVAGAIAFRWPA